MTRSFVRVLAALATVPLLAAVPAQAQQFIEAGNTVTGKASATDQPVMYLFVGEVGSTVTFDLTGAGPVGIDLFDREGEKILSAEGEGKARLEAVLPFTEPYMVAVRRNRKSAPYTLTMAATVPDPHQKVFALAIGYGWLMRDGETGDQYAMKSCWLDPGKKKRNVWPRGIEDIAIGRDGMEYAVSTRNGQQPRINERRVEIDGPTVTYRNRQPDGTERVVTTKVTTERSADVAPYNAYLCK